MKVESTLEKIYENYYEPNPSLFIKRAISARQAVSHMLSMLPNRPYASLLDIGAGEGSVLAELNSRSFAKEYHAVELSRSGVAAIERRAIAPLRSIRQFDGYHVEAPDHGYEIGAAIHVLEHVEHERAFIREVVRVCNIAYIEVPLELTGSVDDFIRAGRPYGAHQFLQRLDISKPDCYLWRRDIGFQDVSQHQGI